MSNFPRSPRNGPVRFMRTPLVAALIAASPGLYAQGLEEVVVTAQKRAQNLQDVPISIETLSTQKIAELGIQDFNDYARMLPVSLSNHRRQVVSDFLMSTCVALRRGETDRQRPRSRV